VAFDYGLNYFQNKIYVVAEKMASEFYNLFKNISENFNEKYHIINKTEYITIRKNRYFSVLVRA